jgi:hypothetical protein
MQRGAQGGTITSGALRPMASIYLIAMIDINR